MFSQYPSLFRKLSLSRSQNKAYSHAYSTWKQLSHLQRMDRFWLAEIVSDTSIELKCLNLQSSNPTLMQGPPKAVNNTVVSPGSDLEASSLSRTDDSVAPLAFQPSALPNVRPNCSSRTKLDYCHSVNPSTG